MDQRGQPGQGGMAFGCGGVPAVAPGREGHVRLALFEHPQHGEVAVNPADGIRDDPAALVHHEPGPHAPALQLCHQLWASVPGPFLRAGGGQIHILRRRISLRQQLLRRLQEGHHGTLGVRCAAAPDQAVRNVPGEGIMLPFSLRGHHVLVAHQHQRPVMPHTGPEIQQVSVDLRFLQLPVHPGKQLLQHPVEPQKLLPLVRFRHGHRFILHHPRQLFRQPPGLLGIRVRNIGGFLSRRPQGADHSRAQQRQQQGQDAGQRPDDPHHFASPRCSRRNFR